MKTTLAFALMGATSAILAFGLMSAAFGYTVDDDLQVTYVNSGYTVDDDLQVSYPDRNYSTETDAYIMNVEKEIMGSVSLNTLVKSSTGDLFLPIN